MMGRGLALSLATGGVLPGRAIELAAEAVGGGVAVAMPDGVDFVVYPTFHPIDERAPSESFLKTPLSADTSPVRIYDMLLEGIRALDQDAGEAFLERFLRRPDELWARYEQKVWRLPALVDYRRTPDEMLDFLRAHVGFGPTSGLPDQIASRVAEGGPTGLRKLIKLAVPYWTRRGRRDALSDSIRTLASGIRPIIDDWFAMRFLVDEVSMGVVGEPGADPWLVLESVLSLGSDDPDADGEVQVSLRVPDLGDLDRQLVEDLVQLARPVGERYEIAWVDFLDTFTDGRLGVWGPRAGTAAVWTPPRSALAPGALPGLLFAEGTRESIDAPAARTWTRYVLTFVVGMLADATFRVRFYVRGDLSYYCADLTAPGEVVLRKVLAGVSTTLATGTADLTAPAPRGVRVEVDAAGGPNAIRVYVDNVLAVEHTSDSDLSAGGVEFECVAGAASLHRVELFQNPLAITILPGVLP